MTDQGSEPADRLEISSAEQFKALGHPLRHRLLFALGQEAATISQLATALDTRKGNIAHHLGVLRDAGMVQLAGTRQVRGGTEQYYRRSAKIFDFTGEGRRANTGVALQAVAAELEGATGEPLLNLRNIRLTERQASELMEKLDGLVDSLEDAGPGEARYGVLVTVYRPRQ
ncbi:DNA-binding transcriptional ArsR family regulator [Kribbella voronezhensis]|uniref:DNA-binding transcriptional ArsR family regulator n=1 Tax=Kribbella voronezhensis TaxID=2512212 RepID=A0A4R7T5K8_9ACTN|nr:helix-turn-helix domain-containing protein [Kribbella voronezhensis]TDU86955.1 DNA-binding transcriptional ArsR family regulator [Kribbella voronezhensis]